MAIIEPENPEFKLINDFIQGDESAFNRIAKKYQEKIYWHARRMTGNHLDADEIVQEVLMVMYTKLNKFNFQSGLYTWIYRITSTRSLNLIKRRKIKSLLGFDEIKDDIRLPEDVILKIEHREKFNDLQKFLNKLPPKQREIVIFKNFDELSYEEISQITGKSVGTLKANYFHAIKKLKDMMNNEY